MSSGKTGVQKKEPQRGSFRQRRPRIEEAREDFIPWKSIKPYQGVVSITCVRCAARTDLQRRLTERFLADHTTDAIVLVYAAAQFPFNRGEGWYVKAKVGGVGKEYVLPQACVIVSTEK